jgi:surfeit locus 1 family protein
MLRAALRPRWLIGHIIVIVLVVGFVIAGFWQLRRLDERNTENARIEAREKEPVVAYGEVSSEAETDPESVDFRRVEIEGTYDPTGEVLIRGRALDGESGFLVVTPLVSELETVLVARGWVPFAFGDGTPLPVAESLPPTEPVTVTGYLRLAEVKGLLGATDPATGTLQEMARIDVGRIDDQYDADLEPMWIQLSSQDPAGAPYPRVIPAPQTVEGNNFSYAMQWFAFAIVALVAWPLIVKRGIQKRASKDSRAAHPVPPPGVDSMSAPTGA